MKPVVIGMNNPYSNDPRYALYPHPQKSAGYRLYDMLRQAAYRENMMVSLVNYVDRFDRFNLVTGEEWNVKEAALGAQSLLGTLQDRKVVICGKAVAKAFDLKQPDFSLQKKHQHGFDYWVIPHPSGLCREYNDPFTVRRVGDLLLALYVGSST